MNLNEIKTNEDYLQSLDWVDDHLNLKIAQESPIGQKLEVMVLLIKMYKGKNYSIPYRRHQMLNIN